MISPLSSLRHAAFAGALLLLASATPLTAQFSSCSSAPAGSLCLSSGNVGIGTTTPATTLAIQGSTGTDLLDVSSSTGSSLLHITQAGHVGIGTTTPTSALLYIAGGTLPTNPQFGAAGIVPIWISNAGSSGTSQGMVIIQEAGAGVSGTSATNGINVGLDISANNSNVLTAAMGTGGSLRNRYLNTINGTGNVTGMSNVSARITNNGSSVLTAGANFNVEPPTVGANAFITTLAGLWIQPTTAGSLTGTLSNYRGVYVQKLNNTNITNTWGIYQEDSGDKNYFAGNVGIGTPSPCSVNSPTDCRLSVNGAIQAKEVVVSTGWADYVFAPDYPLQPLAETAVYIEQNHRLPGIPSAREVEDKGVSLGDMQAKLLAKVEELTLHMIEAQQKSEQLEDRVRQLQNEVAELQSRHTGSSSAGMPATARRQ